MASSGEEKKYTTSELMASAKVVAEAAQTGFGKESEADKAKAAQAAGDLLDAVGQYAKLDDNKGAGQYVDKAADYLHQYQSTNTNTTAAPPTSKPDQPKSDDVAPKSEEAVKSEDGGGSGGIGGLGGDFAKVAGGFFK
ncbi:nodulin-related protein 2-like [Vicia villosa]|uniref:nodulin-related protein 2-like n=1 Tax=Vicia villosa TaxID=3911 RepID=UPI00273CBB56|nr:nodulin-related protein 2-like [Vicia villosa]